MVLLNSPSKNRTAPMTLIGLSVARAMTVALRFVRPCVFTGASVSSLYSPGLSHFCSLYSLPAHALSNPPRFVH